MNGLKIKPNLRNIAILCMILTPMLLLPLSPLVSTMNNPVSQNNCEELSPIEEVEINLTPKTAGVYLPVVNSPANIWRRSGDAAYVEWIASDADVALGEEAGDYTVNGSKGTYSGLLPWYSGEPLHFPIAGAYDDDNWTVYVYDLDGNMVNHTIGTNWWIFEQYPLLKSITIVQDGEEYDIKDKPYIETGKGNFEFKVNWEDANIWQPVYIPFTTIPIPGLHNPNVIRSVQTELRGYYPNFDFNFYIPSFLGDLQLHCDDVTPDGAWILIPIPPFIWYFDNLLTNVPRFLLPKTLPNFVQGGDSFKLTIGSSKSYMWRTWALAEVNPIFQQLFYKNVQNIEYRVTNQFTLFIETGDIFTANDFFVYDQKRYNNNNLLTIDLENRDVNAPTCVSQNASQVDEDSNLKIDANIADEFKGSGVDVDKVTLYYSVGGSAWGTNRMLYVKEDGVFKGNIAPPGAGASVTYYIEMYDMEGNVQNTEYFYYTTPAKEVPAVIITLIGIVAVAIGAVAVTIIYRKRNQPAIITLPSKKKVDKYYKKINKEEG